MQPTGVLETSKATNPLKELLKYGQSMWLDYIRRDLITTGNSGTGVTFSPSRDSSLRRTA